MKTFIGCIKAATAFCFIAFVVVPLGMEIIYFLVRLVVN